MPYPESLIQEIATRHGLSGSVSLMPDGGMVNEAWSIGGTHILRIVREGRDAECDDEAARESAIVPLLVEAGVTTPRLVASDWTSGPRPYTVYEMAQGELLGFSKLRYEHFMPACKQIGRELARLHRIEVTDEVRARLREQDPIDVAKWVGRSIEKGALSQAEADEVLDFAKRLLAIKGTPLQPCLIHEDVHPWNVMVDASLGGLTALIDWGDATYGDRARDFATMPLPCVPAMLDGYCEAGGLVDDAFVARSIVVGLNTALWEARTPEMCSFERHWWRMPPGGWSEIKQLVERHWPNLTS